MGPVPWPDRRARPPVRMLAIGVRRSCETESRMAPLSASLCRATSAAVASAQGSSRRRATPAVGRERQQATRTATGIGSPATREAWSIHGNVGPDRHSTAPLEVASRPAGSWSWTWASPMRHLVLRERASTAYRGLARSSCDRARCGDDGFGSGRHSPPASISASGGAGRRPPELPLERSCVAMSRLMRRRRLAGADRPRRPVSKQRGESAEDDHDEEKRRKLSHSAGSRPRT
jgi:hypothetical protein